jgi:VWFA-related protein
VRLLLPAAALLLTQAVISVHTELVTVPVSVTDRHGHHVGALTREHFRVFEDGRLQPITVFHHGAAPVTLGLVVDRSQSMGPKRSALLATLSVVLGSVRPEDELFGVGFSDGVAFALAGDRPFTSDSAEIAASLAAMPTGGRTALYDGVNAALQHLQLGRAERQALIVLSDGGDNVSLVSYPAIVALARRANVVIYAIGLLAVSQIGEEEEDAGKLRRLCKDTGGLSYFPRSAGEIVAAAADVARDLREQYTLGFEPGPRIDGRTFRRIEVKVSAPGHGRLQVRTRPGYAVPDSGDGKDDPGVGRRRETP